MKTFAVMLMFALCAASAFAGDRFFSPASDKTVRSETYVPAGVQKVWASLATGDGWKTFLGTDATIEMRPGGKFEVLFVPEAPEGQQGSEGCTVLSYLPERMLSFTWNAPPQFPSVRAAEHKTIVVIDLMKAGADRTLVRLTQHGWPGAGETSAEWDGAFEYFSKAWPGVLEALAKHHAPAMETPSQLPSAGDPELDPKNGWLYTFTGLKRPDLLATLTDEEKKQFSDHAAYIKRLCLEGTMVFAGPCRDMKGPAVVILDVRKQADAERLMNEDPAVKHGLMKASLHPVRLSFIRWRDQ